MDECKPLPASQRPEEKASSASAGPATPGATAAMALSARRRAHPQGRPYNARHIYAVLVGRGK